MREGGWPGSQVNSHSLIRRIYPKTLWWHWTTDALKHLRCTTLFGTTIQIEQGSDDIYSNHFPVRYERARHSLVWGVLLFLSYLWDLRADRSFFRILIRIPKIRTNASIINVLSRYYSTTFASLESRFKKLLWISKITYLYSRPGSFLWLYYWVSTLPS